ncbi:heavy-metal-associated domain-containing protein [sulfur-oxidizing endosymbiont of Gigantopelta aegis]|uniref:heavy-metal-associated domain-containing protein n=1 Tax=sulfur-oxidizing endosymbiont of Gigantopelta aegis TaxID=2794934 RepID=UPI0018DE7C64|nr:cation transporter [sulfur-oxidizing endosymbiont of Gigantopelta aegis]
MKSLLISLSLLFFLVLSSLASGKQVVNIDINGMSCKFCAYSVQKSLNTLPGVEKADVNIDTNKAQVVMVDGHEADIELIKKKIIESGFSPAKVTLSNKDN